jgi:hypothetical protein
MNLNIRLEDAIWHRAMAFKCMCMYQESGNAMREAEYRAAYERWDKVVKDATN